MYFACRRAGPWRRDALATAGVGTSSDCRTKGRCVKGVRRRHGVRIGGRGLTLSVTPVGNIARKVRLSLEPGGWRYSLGVRVVMAASPP